MTGAPPDPPEAADPSLAALRTAVLSEETVYRRGHLRVGLVEIATADGVRRTRPVVRLRRVAVAAVLDAEDRVLLLWRHRFVTDQWGWELPGGIVDAGEDPAAAAARELEEETGWRPGPLVPLLAFQPMPGMVDAPVELFLARGAEQVGAPSDPAEAGRVAWVPLADVPALIRAGEVLGAGSLVGLLHLLAMR